MNKISLSTRSLFTIALAGILAVGAFADTLRLKDGSLIKGRIVSFGAGKFVVVIGEGSRQRELTFTADEVESIQFEAVSARTDSVAAKDTEFIETSSPPRSIPRVVTTDGAVTTKTTPENRPSAASNQPQPAATVPTRPAGAKPIEVSVKVLADNTTNGWTNTGWVVRKGQRIRVIGSGSVSLGKGRTAGPSGLYDLEDPTKLLKSVPTGALIAVIGDDNNEFIYIGSERTFTAARDGALFLGVNEGNLDDNSGSYEVRIEIDPA